MGLVLKFIVTTGAGTYHYRRRVPKAVASVIHRREFKKFLGRTEREALAAWPRVNAEVEREIAKAQQAVTWGAGPGPTTELEAFTEARRRVAELAEAGADSTTLDIVADTMVDSHKLDPETGEPIGVSPVDRHTINLLRSGLDRGGAMSKPDMTLADAKRFYVQEHLGENADPRTLGRINRVVAQAEAALGSNLPVIQLTREDARKVRDHMLSRLKRNGKPVAVSSVRRELNDLKAIINHAQTEQELPGTFQNPFNKLPLGNREQAETAAQARDPLPPGALHEVRRRVVGHSGAELALMWRLLEGTGCRLAEIAGLRVEDIVLDGPTGSIFPHVKVMWHEDRHVKTLASLRHVPLVGDALDAAKDALELPRKGHMVFPSYGRVGGPTAASAALMKHVRRVTENPKHVVHSLRHNMKDNLILAEVSTLDQNLILGHALGGIGDRVYGGDMAKLRVTTRAMKRAMSVPLSAADERAAVTDENGEE